jgi:release factor glutamine methyltransferase
MSPSSYRVYASIVGALRSNPMVYRLLFGHWPARQLRGQLWDWTTLALAAALRRLVRPGASVLDMGTGPAGVLAVYAKHRLGSGTTRGVDRLPDLLPSAADTADRCSADVAFSRGTLFSCVEGRFDVIVFNAPYIPLATGRRLGVLRQPRDEQRWGGGATGLETIERFLLQAPRHLEPGGCILLGTNHFYLPAALVGDAIADAGLVESWRIAHRVTRACAYALHPSAEGKQQA